MDKQARRQIIVPSRMQHKINLNQLYDSMRIDATHIFVEIVVESYAQVVVSVVGVAHRKTYDIIVRLYDHAVCNQVINTLPNTLLHFKASYRLQGYGSLLTIGGLTESGSGDVHRIETEQIHCGVSTKSNVELASIVDAGGTCDYDGLIRIVHGAKQTQALQNHRVLLLEKTAHASSHPCLEINENNVVCSHASSFSYLDPLELWALESKGIEPSVARCALIQGFRDQFKK